MIEGTRLCGAVHWRLDGRPDGVTVCDCTACRRYGVLWAHGHDGEDVVVSGTTRSYAGGDALDFVSCPVCGCLVAWRARQAGDDGRRRIAVNVRLAEPETVASIPIDRLDGLVAFEGLPRDGRCVAEDLF